MRRSLDLAAEQIAERARTPATKAKMAQRILQLASEGVTDPQELVATAIDEARESESESVTLWDCRWLTKTPSARKCLSPRLVTADPATELIEH
jgi:hypothetical protein